MDGVTVNHREVIHNLTGNRVDSVQISNNLVVTIELYYEG